MSSDVSPGEGVNQEFEASQALFDHVRNTIGDESIKALISEAEAAQLEGLYGAFLEEEADFTVTVNTALGSIAVLSMRDLTVHTLTIAEAMEQMLPDNT